LDTEGGSRGVIEMDRKTIGRLGPCSVVSRTVRLTASGRGGIAGAVAWAVVGDSDTLGGDVALAGVPDPLRARLQRGSH
jgi:hypothetical protein